MLFSIYLPADSLNSRYATCLSIGVRFSLTGGVSSFGVGSTSVGGSSFSSSTTGLADASLAAFAFASAFGSALPPFAGVGSTYTGSFLASSSFLSYSYAALNFSGSSSICLLIEAICYEVYL